MLLPFCHNLWDGYLCPSQDARIYKIPSDDIQRKLEPYIGNMLRVMRDYGAKLDPAFNVQTSKGCKASSTIYNKHDPELFGIIDSLLNTIAKRASESTGVNLLPAPCCEEEYCWFTRVYENENDFLSWHFDTNFSSGIRFTYVHELYVSNKNASHFMTLDRAQNITVFTSKTGNNVLYDGSKTKHAISKQASDSTRIVLVVPLYQNYKHNTYGKYRREIRKIVYKKMNL